MAEEAVLEQEWARSSRRCGRDVLRNAAGVGTWGTDRVRGGAQRLQGNRGRDGVGAGSAGRGRGSVGRASKAKGRGGN
ncbi:hypothetical protein E2562_036068, partial [Oryza meyeriana var. granulata]